MKEMKIHARPLFLLIVGALVLVVSLSCAKKPLTKGWPVEDKYRLARQMLEDADYADARQLFESVIFESPGSVYADSALYFVGRCYFEQGDYELAAGEFRRFYMQYPTSELVDDAELMRARCFFEGAPNSIGLDQDYLESCVNILRTFRDDHPNSELLPAADSLLNKCYGRLSRKDYRAAKLYQRMGAHTAARLYLQLVLDNYPDSPYVPEAIYRMGETYRKQEQYDSAQVWYEKLIYLYPEQEITEKARKRLLKVQPHLDPPPSAEEGP